MTLDAKLRMLRVMDKICNPNTDSGMPDTQTKHDRLGSNRSVGFDEFLLADKDGDGRVSSAEWEAFLQKKALAEKGMDYQEVSGYYQQWIDVQIADYT